VREKPAYAALVQAGAEALWSAFNGGQERPLPPELRSDHEKAARAVLDAVLPALAEQVRQASYAAEVTTRDFGPAVHPDLAGDLLADLATAAKPDSGVCVADEYGPCSCGGCVL
jgi:hypothetical protein